MATIIDNTSAIEASVLQKASLFLRLASEAIVNTSERNTPMKTGDLRQRVLKQVSGLSAKIVWGTNYAIYQEEKQFKNYTTPGTGPHFARNAVGEVLKDFSALVKQSGLT